MADFGSGSVPPDVAAGYPPQNFKLRSELSLLKVAELVSSLHQSGSGPNGAELFGSYFDPDMVRVPKLLVRYKQPENATTIDEHSVLKILRAISAYFRSSTDYMRVIKGLSDGKDAQYNYYNLIVTGDPKGIVSEALLLNVNHQKEVVEKLVELIQLLLENEDLSETETSIEIPAELELLITRKLDSSWPVLFGQVITPLYLEGQRNPNSAPTLEFGGISYNLPVFRKLLKKWLEATFKHPDYKKYFEPLTDSQKKSFELPTNSVGAANLPDQINADDVAALKKLSEDFKKIVEGILALKEPDQIETLKKLFDEAPRTESGGGESDETQEEKPEEKPEEQPVAETITLQQAIEEALEAIAAQLYQFAFIEEQLEPYDQTLSTSQQNFVRQQIHSEARIRLKRSVPIEKNIQDAGSTIYDATNNAVFVEAFRTWLASYPVVALSQGAYSSFQEAEFRQLGKELIEASLPFTSLVDDDVIANNDLSPKSVEATKLDQLVAEYQASLAENPQYDQELYTATETRLEGVLLAYLQNSGLENLKTISDIDSLNPLLRNQFKGEIAAFLQTLSPEEKLQLSDPAFAAIVGARFNRQLLLGRFASSSVYSQIHQAINSALLRQQADLQKNINAVAGEGALQLASGSQKDIESMTVEQFEAAFGVDLPTSLSAAEFARYKKDAIARWKPAFQQSAVIQKLILLYGEDYDFIRALNSVDKLNLVFGLQLPSTLSETDVAALQNNLIAYWQIEITKQIHDRNLEYNDSLQKGLGVDQNDENDAATLAYLKKLQTRRLVQPLIGSNRDDYQFDDPDVLNAHKNLYEGASAFGEYYDALYIYNAEQDDLRAMMALNKRWELALLLNQQLAAEAAAADQTTIAAMMAAQIGPDAYSGSSIKNQGFLGKLGQRFGRKTAAQKAKAAMTKAGTDAALNAVGAATGPVGSALATLNKISDAIQSLTGLNKTGQAIGLGALLGFALYKLINALSTWGGAIGGAIGGVLGGLVGGVPGAAAGFVGGAFVGDGIANAVGINSPIFSTEAGAGANLANAFQAPAAAGATAAQLGTTAANTSGVILGSFTAVTVFTTFMAITTIQSALLLPELTDINEAVSITKTATPLSAEDPTTVAYTITVRPRDGFTVTVRSASDSFGYRFNKKVRDSKGLTTEPTDPPSNPEYLSAQSQMAALAGQTLTDEVTFSYIVPFGSEFDDAKITNTFVLTYDAVATTESGSESFVGRTASASTSTCFGECPQPEGCFEFADQPSQFAAQRMVTEKVTGKAWTEQEKNRVLAAFEQRAGTSQRYVDLLCGTATAGSNAGSNEADDSEKFTKTDQNSSQKPIRLYRFNGTTYGGWALETDAIGLYDLAFNFSDASLEYTLVHETGHILSYRNSGLSSGFPASDCHPTYPAACNEGEYFPEGVALYVVHSTYKFGRLGDALFSFDSKPEYQDQYEYLKSTVFGGVEF